MLLPPSFEWRQMGREGKQLVPPFPTPRSPFPPFSPPPFHPPTSICVPFISFLPELYCTSSINLQMGTRPADVMTCWWAVDAAAYISNNNNRQEERPQHFFYLPCLRVGDRWSRPPAYVATVRRRSVLEKVPAARVMLPLITRGGGSNREIV